jgi:malate synthase
VGVRYTQAWIEGRGAVPLYNLMEDAATAEICRTQLWQWIRLGADLDDGRTITSELFVGLLTDEMADLRRDFPSPRLEDAAHLFTRMVLADDLEEFLTLPAYELIA